MNFRLTAALAEKEDLALALRIDDADAARYRRAYVDDIFGRLAQMGITWSIGPVDAVDFEAHWSQRRKTEQYRSELRQLERGREIYACVCTRKELSGLPVGGCACRLAQRTFVAGSTALRVHVPLDTVVSVGDRSVALAQEMGDFVIWRKDDLPSYQWVSVLEDRNLGTTHIVRGADLVASSAAQVFLADAMGASNVVNATYVHHNLILDDAGRKLSKSQMPG